MKPVETYQRNPKKAPGKIMHQSHLSANSLSTSSIPKGMTDKSPLHTEHPIISEHREGLTTDAHDWTMIQAGSLVYGQKVITM